MFDLGLLENSNLGTNDSINMLFLRAPLAREALSMQMHSINLVHKWHCTKIAATSHSRVTIDVRKITS